MIFISRFLAALAQVSHFSVSLRTLVLSLTKTLNSQHRLEHNQEFALMRK